jgi:hypothetical protein
MIEHTNGVSGKIILDSVNPEGIRLTTLHMRYPRMVHSELMTHRVFTRNGRSSRAVPVKTLLEEDGYMPHFMKNKPGMVASEEMSEEDRKKAEILWTYLESETKAVVHRLNLLGVHKQWANRPLEAFGYIDVLISSTEWANFMALRDDEAAQPEIKSVAELIKKLMNESKPQTCVPGTWHLPYIKLKDDLELVLEYKGYANASELKEGELLDLLRKISTARCARLSIRPFDGDSSIEKELARYEKLVVSRPVHASPAEHIATPDTLVEPLLEPYGTSGYENWDQHGNFNGWIQYRKLIPHNTIEDR